VKRADTIEEQAYTAHRSQMGPVSMSLCRKGREPGPTYLCLALFAIEYSRQPHQYSRRASRTTHRTIAHDIAILTKIRRSQWNLLHHNVSHGLFKSFR
jgi:hypothetical protein